MTFNNSFEKIASENTDDLGGGGGGGSCFCACFFFFFFSGPSKCRLSCSFHKAMYDYVE